jgi:hypothetical protein
MIAAGHTTPVHKSDVISVLELEERISRARKAIKEEDPDVPAWVNIVDRGEANHG